jgi:hypothetical protein
VLSVSLLGAVDALVTFSEKDNAVVSLGKFVRSEQDVEDATGGMEGVVEMIHKGKIARFLEVLVTAYLIQNLGVKFVGVEIRIGLIPPFILNCLSNSYLEPFI